MIGNLSRRERVLISLGVLAAVVVLGWEGVVQPLRERHRAAAELVPAREEVLARRQQLVARKATIATDLETTNARVGELNER
ncbi:MAG TPA: type II secretion system protein GspM, partial [Methylomirabilota bacterium]|nr:type II secretion system protein GspM [Methylomirabilota bacterium]